MTIREVGVVSTLLATIVGAAIYLATLRAEISDLRSRIELLDLDAIRHERERAIETIRSEIPNYAAGHMELEFTLTIQDGEMEPVRMIPIHEGVCYFVFQGIHFDEFSSAWINIRPFHGIDYWYLDGRTYSKSTSTEITARCWRFPSVPSN